MFELYILFLFVCVLNSDFIACDPPESVHSHLDKEHSYQHDDLLRSTDNEVIWHKKLQKWQKNMEETNLELGYQFMIIEMSSMLSIIHDLQKRLGQLKDVDIDLLELKYYIRKNQFVTNKIEAKLGIEKTDWELPLKGQGKEATAPTVDQRVLNNGAEEEKRAVGYGVQPLLVNPTNPVVKGLKKEHTLPTTSLEILRKQGNLAVSVKN